MKNLIKTYYQIQDLRIGIDNNLRAVEQGKSKAGEVPLMKTLSAFLKDTEKEIIKVAKKSLKEERIYSEWLAKVKGIGPTLATGLIAEINNIERFETISKLWAYSGLHVAEDGKVVKRRRGEKANWNTNLKRTSWLVGEAFVKGGGAYRELYDKFRAEYDKKWKTPKDCGSTGCKNKGKGKCMDGHRHAAAKRKTVKVFLAHLYMKWREIEGLPVREPFIIGKGKHEHIIAPLVDE